MEAISIPIVSIRNVERVRRIFTYTEDEENLRLNYVEPLVEQHGKYLWRIEYRVDRNSKYHDNAELTRLLMRIKHRIGRFECVNVYFNLLDRIYMYVPPQLSSDSRSAFAKKTEKRKGRDLIRMKNFKKDLASMTEKAEGLGFNTESIKEFSQNEQRHRLEKFLNSKEPTNNEDKQKQEPQRKHSFIGKLKPIKFVSGEVLAPESTEVKDKPSSLPVDTPIHELPVKKIIEDSMKSSEKRFAKSRIFGHDHFPMIRRYVSHLHDCGYGFVNTLGESKMSVEAIFMREGIPIGKDLVNLYIEAVKDRGYTEEEVREDLAGMKAFEQTSRIIRLQTAREKTRAWFGLKGGSLYQFGPVDHPYYTLHHEMIRCNGSRGTLITISDMSGELQIFN